MRALFLLAVGVLAVWAVLYLNPGDEAQAGPPGGVDDHAAAGAEQAQGSPEQGTSPSSAGIPDAPVALPAPSAPGPDRHGGPQVASAASGGESGTGGGDGGAADPAFGLAPDPVLLGAVIAHGGPDEVRAFLDKWSVDREHPQARLAVAFAEATADGGDRPLALELSAGLQDEGGNDTLDLAMLGLALGRMTAGDFPPSSRSESPVTRGMVMVMFERRARKLVQAHDDPGAASMWSELLLRELDAPWPPSRPSLADWSAELRRAQRNHRWDPRGDWPSITVEVQPNDSLVVIRKRVLRDHPDLKLCTGLIARANRKAGRSIHPGEVLQIPTEPAHTIVDLEARWMLYLHGDEVVDAWDIGIGKPGQETYVGEFQVLNKQEDPMWFPGNGREPVPFGHEDNPLGTRWIGWSYPDGTQTHLGFHGTNEPGTMGQAVSMGCIRMRNPSVEELFEILPIGSRVEVKP